MLAKATSLMEYSRRHQLLFVSSNRVSFAENSQSKFYHAEARPSSLGADTTKITKGSSNMRYSAAHMFWSFAEQCAFECFFK